MDQAKFDYLRHQTLEIHDPPTPILSVSVSGNFKNWIISRSGLSKNHLLKKGDKIYKINKCTVPYFYRLEAQDMLHKYHAKKLLPIQFYVAEFPDDLYGVIHQIEIERDGKKMTIIPHSPKE